VSRFQPWVAVGILISTSLLTVPVASAAKSKTTTYGYACCSGSSINTVYYAGDLAKFEWIRLTDRPGKQVATTLTLSVQLSGPFKSVADLKNAFGTSHPTNGRTTMAAAPIRLSNKVVGNPVSSIRIRASAGAGFYELTTKEVNGPVTVTGGSVVRIKR
jgi:hypothetical protein